MPNEVDRTERTLTQEGGKQTFAAREFFLILSRTARALDLEAVI